MILKLRNVLDGIIIGFNWIAVVLICFMTVSTILDVVLRAMDSPLPGIFELNEAAMGIAVFSSLTYTWVKGGHVRVELIVKRFSTRWRSLADTLAALIGFVVFALITWRTWIWASFSMRMSETTDILRMPIAPVKFWVCLASALMCLRLLISFFHSLLKIVGKNEN